MKSTFHTPRGGTIVVEPSPTKGGIWITTKHPDAAPSIVMVPLHLAGSVAQAIEGAATVIEEGCLRPELPAAPRHLADMPELAPLRRAQ